MALLKQTQLGCATLLVTVLLSLSSTGDGFKQELWMYTADNTTLYFQTHVPNLNEFSATLPMITRVCGIGIWLLSTAVNYQTLYAHVGSWTKELGCGALNVTTVKSLRHFAANDTATEAISLYSGDNLVGEEIFVTRAKTDISIPILTFAATGTSDWMLYEGKNFDGKSSCFQVALSGLELNYGYVHTLNMTTIGSVFKDCDLHEIQLYKESLLL